MKKDDGKAEKGAIEIIEEAMHLLRFSPPGLLLIYYTGTLPFVLGLLFFWGDMSRSAFASEYCAGASLTVAALFIWMKCWHSVFFLHLMARIGTKKVHRWSLKRILRLVAAQTIYQPSGLFLLPASVILLFPLGWVYAFYQNITIQRYERPLDLKSSFERSVHLSRLWPKQNHLILVIIFLFGIFVFLNVCSAIVFIPFLLNKLLGIETIFTLSGAYFFNTTFLAAALGITFLCIDPIIKTLYSLRYFYGLSIKSGEDMKVELKNRFKRHKTAFAVLLIIFFSLHPGVTAAEDKIEAKADVSQDHPALITSERLSNSIDEVMARPEFAWRLPREKEVEEGIKAPGFFSFLERWSKKIAGAISDFFRKIANWVKGLFPEKTPGTNKAGSDWGLLVKVLLYGFIGLVACAAAVYIFRLFKRRKAVAIPQATAIQSSVPDLSDEQLSADDLPLEGWIKLALDLIAEGSLRLALRAFYFATINHLASKNMLLIAPYKSNRDYIAELRRRAHEEKELVTVFSKNVTFFDKAWYGMYDVTMKHVEAFSSNHKRITALAR